MYENEADCPICLDPMSPSDHAHPLLCTTKCGYNFCLTCVESLITSAKDDFGEASDGNMHVKIYLHCPNCRSDLSSSIRDTVLLRKADFLKENAFGSEDDLTATQLRFKRSIGNKEVQDAIVEAQTRERDFLGSSQHSHRRLDELIEINENQQQQDYCPELFESADDYIEEVEEMGVEADLLHGVYSPHVVFVKRNSFEEKKIATDGDSSTSNIDKSLFGGLDFAMTDDEQDYITQLMTSGDVAKLATAAEAMLGVREICRRGMTPHFSPSKRNKRGSILALIDESKAAKSSNAAKAANAQKTHIARHNNHIEEKRAHHRAMERKLQKQAEFMKTHPLPVRMPKCVELTLSDPSSKAFSLSFCNDVWDGTVMDAYSKITLSGGGSSVKVNRKRTENKGVYRVLNGGVGDDDCGDARIDVPSPRILVSSVKNEGGDQGVMKGDVVTHLDGEELGDMTAEGLVEELRKRALNDCANTTFRLVLNAELSVAEALRRRAMIKY